MKKLAFIFLSMSSAILALISLEDTPAMATTDIMVDFSDMYGSKIVLKFSCDICHNSGKTSLNAYGKDYSSGGGESCQEYNAPSNHDILEASSSCSAYHRSGYQRPLAGNCRGCHGNDLNGESAPSCYTCHGRLWQNTAVNKNPDFQRAPGHNSYESDDGRGAYHMSGYEKPFDRGCNNCHGSNLRGDTGPSCYTCHGAEWNDDDEDNNSNGIPSPVLHSGQRIVHQSAFAAAIKGLESVDSDNDGFSNIEEIRALTNPGDSKSHPADQGVFNLLVARKWKADWIKKTGNISFKLERNDVTKLDLTKPVTLSDGKVSIDSLNITENKNSFTIEFRRASLVQFMQNNSFKDFAIYISAPLRNGLTYAHPFEVDMVESKYEVYSTGVARIEPTQYEPGSDIKVVLKDSMLRNLDTSRNLYVHGLDRRRIIEDYDLVDDRIEFTITPSLMSRLFSTMSENVIYTMVIQGYNKEPNTFLGVALNFTTTGSVSDGSAGGGGGSDGGSSGGGSGTNTNCKSFNPPSNHTVARVDGSCTYYHMPGMTSPVSNGCVSCHGSDLRGSSYAPGCFECHGQIW